MKKNNRSHQAQTKEGYPPKSSYVSQATSKMTDEIKELLHDAITVGSENNRMLRWLIIECLPIHKKSKVRQPDISDILDDVEKT